MRTLVLLILCIAVVCGVPALAQYTTSPAKINLELKDTPLAEAIKAVFKGMGASYALDPAVTDSPMKVTMNLKGVMPEDALNAVLVAGGLIRRKQGEIYYIKPKAIESPVPIESLVPEAYPGEAQRREAERDPRLVPITLVVPEMPIAEALTKIGAASSLAGAFTRKTMPGARFFQFPREMAETILFVTAGLVPPVGGDPQTVRAGQSDLSQLLQWVSSPGAKPTGATQGTFGGSGFGGFGSSGYSGGYYTPTPPSPSGDLAIAAYVRQGKWLFTIFASQVQDARLLEGLFSTGGRSYVMGDVSLRPQKTVQMVDGKRIEGTAMTSYHQTVSAQLYDVTLDQALDALLPSLGLIYRKQGMAANPTYVIELAGSSKPTSAPPGASVKPPAKKPRR